MFEGLVPLVVMGKEGKEDEPTSREKTEGVFTGTYSGTTCAGGLVDIHVECTGLSSPFCCATSLITFTYECNCFEFSGVNSNGTTYKTTVTGPALNNEPSCIAVDDGGRLFVSFESTNVPETNGNGYEVSSITPGSSSGAQIGECKAGQSSFGCDVLCCVCLLIECSNDDDNGEGEDNTRPSPPAHDGVSTPSQNNYTAVPGEWESGSITSSGITVTPDVWHHVLISVDLKPIKTHGLSLDENFERPIAKYVDSASKLWIALDDKNYNKDDLNSYWTGGDDNEVVSNDGGATAGSTPARDENSPDYGVVNTYSVEMSVPSGDIGIPAPAKYKDSVYHCEMAEFQMWTGQTLDTGSEKNRRLFLDYKRDDKGNPIPDKDGQTRLRPVNPKVAEDTLGTPTIRLHGSGKWINGKNTGRGWDPETSTNNTLSFTPTGTIKPYKPDPSVIAAT